MPVEQADNTRVPLIIPPPKSGEVRRVTQTRP